MYRFHCPVLDSTRWAVKTFCHSLEIMDFEFFASAEGYFLRRLDEMEDD